MIGLLLEKMNLCDITNMGVDIMESMPKKQIEEIALNILDSGDIIAKHGTSVKNALSIINTGFDFHRTSFVMQISKSIESLCGYGWKENGPNDSANVIIEVPREFFMGLLYMSSIDEYNSWIQNIKSGNQQEGVLNSVTTFEYFEVKNDGFFMIPPTFKAHIPQEFIVGAFIWCNGKTYLNLKEDENALDNLNFVPNEKYFLNMQPDEKRKFLSEMRAKLGIEERGKSLK